jgi:MFS family permease
VTRGRGFIAGTALGVCSGWNVGNLGGVASDLAGAYGVGLATIGLFTSALFLTHLAIQVPGGRASDRFGPDRAGAVALLLIAAGNGIALWAPEVAPAIIGRALTGIGTGFAFICGNALVRESGGSPFAQGLFGGISLGAGGLALALVPQVEAAWAWRTPYVTSLLLAAAGLGLLIAAGRGEFPRRRAGQGHGQSKGVFLDRRLHRLAVSYATSFGLSAVLGNWVAEFLTRHASLAQDEAAAIGALTLIMGIATRPLGGWVLRRHPTYARFAVGLGLASGAAGTLVLILAGSAWPALIGSVLVGAGAGIPFSPAFTGAALTRPDAPSASVGMVNTAACFVILVGTPLMGLTFSLSGEGRIGFGVVAALWLVALAFLPSRAAMGVR